MAKWRVYNRHPDGLTHKEKFRDEPVEIKAGEFVLMDYEDAVLFRGQYFPMNKDPMGQPDRKSFKVIHIERDPDGEMEDEKKNERFICNLDGKHFPNQEALNKHIRMNYSDLIFKDQALEEEIEKKQGRR